MQPVFYLVLRRLRRPLVVLVLVYAIAVIGLVLIPGIDGKGMSYFHAFYFVSFMGSTIGFGEIPLPFTDGQRFFTLVMMYITVVAWFYAIGTLIALLGDPIFRRTFTRNAVIRQVQRLNTPFYIVCGYGSTGRTVVHTLAKQGLRAVTIDHDEQRIESIQLDDIDMFVPRVCGDAMDTEILIDSGLKHRHCVGLLALTDNDQTNLQIAISSKLLNPRLMVICRAGSKEAQLNMDSFHTDYVVVAHQAFADLLLNFMRSPALLALHAWLTGVDCRPRDSARSLPQGRWIVCGFGRYGQAVSASLLRLGNENTVIEIDPVQAEMSDGAIQASGTEAVTLREAGVSSAVGLVAATDNDANNLSILLTAKELNPELYAIARQNRRRNRQLFDAVGLDLVTESSRTIAAEALAILATPLTGMFLDAARELPAERIQRLVASIRSYLIEGSTPISWGLTLDAEVHGSLRAADCPPHIALGDLMRHHRNRNQRLGCECLYLVQNRTKLILPDHDTRLELGARLLFCGSRQARRAMLWTLHHPASLGYCVDGRRSPTGLVWRRLFGRASTTVKEENFTN